MNLLYRNYNHNWTGNYIAVSRLKVQKNGDIVSGKLGNLLDEKKRFWEMSKFLGAPKFMKTDVIKSVVLERINSNKTGYLKKSFIAIVINSGTPDKN